MLGVDDDGEAAVEVSLPEGVGGREGRVEAVPEVHEVGGEVVADERLSRSHQRFEHEAEADLGGELEFLLNAHLLSLGLSGGVVEAVGQQGLVVLVGARGLQHQLREQLGELLEEQLSPVPVEAAEAQLPLEALLPLSLQPLAHPLHVLAQELLVPAGGRQLGGVFALLPLPQPLRSGAVQQRDARRQQLLEVKVMACEKAQAGWLCTKLIIC